MVIKVNDFSRTFGRRSPPNDGLPEDADAYRDVLMGSRTARCFERASSEAAQHLGYAFMKSLKSTASNLVTEMAEQLQELEGAIEKMHGAVNEEERTVNYGNYENGMRHALDYLSEFWRLSQINDLSE